MKIILPKKNDDGEQYLSYSQIYSWKLGKSKYFNMYFYGNKGKSNPYMEFGKTVGEALEVGDFSSFSLEEQEFLETIPRLDEFERQVRLDLEDFFVMGFVDSNTSNLKKIIDYKSGSEDKKEFYESDDYNQLEIYAAAIYQKYKILPEEAEVILYERVGTYGRFKVGSKYWTIKREITKEKLKKTEEDIKEIAVDISRHYQAFLFLNSNFNQNIKE
jgi:hypothetical protein